jgi:hypothetical protein
MDQSRNSVRMSKSEMVCRFRISIGSQPMIEESAAPQPPPQVLNSSMYPFSLSRVHYMLARICEAHHDSTCNHRLPSALWVAHAIRVGPASLLPGAPNLAYGRMDWPRHRPLRLVRGRRFIRFGRVLWGKSRFCAQGGDISFIYFLHISWILARPGDISGNFFAHSIPV